MLQIRCTVPYLTRHFPRKAKRWWDGGIIVGRFMKQAADFMPAI